MDVRTFCLGILALKDSSGYEIKKTLEGSFSHFYDASFGSIYPALNKLADEQLVEATEVSQGGRPAKKVYSITAAGRIALMEALERPAKQDRVRSEFMVQMLIT